MNKVINNYFKSTMQWFVKDLKKVSLTAMGGYYFISLGMAIAVGIIGNLSIYGYIEKKWGFAIMVGLLIVLSMPILYYILTTIYAKPLLYFEMKIRRFLFPVKTRFIVDRMEKSEEELKEKIKEIRVFPYFITMWIYMFLVIVGISIIFALYFGVKESTGFTISLFWQTFLSFLGSLYYHWWAYITIFICLFMIPLDISIVIFPHSEFVPILTSTERTKVINQLIFYFGLLILTIIFVEWDWFVAGIIRILPIVLFIYGISYLVSLLIAIYDSFIKKKEPPPKRIEFLSMIIVLLLLFAGSFFIDTTGAKKLMDRYESNYQKSLIIKSD